MSDPTKPQPSDVLRVALVTLLADLLREADVRLRVEQFDARNNNEPAPGWLYRLDTDEKDADAIRRVMEILQRTNPSPSTNPAPK